MQVPETHLLFVPQIAPSFAFTHVGGVALVLHSLHGLGQAGLHDGAAHEQMNVGCKQLGQRHMGLKEHACIPKLWPYVPLMGEHYGATHAHMTQTGKTRQSRAFHQEGGRRSSSH